MRRIQTKKSKHKKERRNQLIIGTILIIVMFGSVFGIIANSFGDNETSETISYNGNDFLSQNGFWILEKENYNFVFRYNPEEVEKIPGEVNPLDSYLDKPLYISSEDYISEVEIYTNLGSFVQRFQGACFEETCEENLPVKNCTDNFIIIQESENANIVQEDGCVFIQGPAEDLTKITDEFLFKILKIE